MDFLLILFYINLLWYTGLPFFPVENWWIQLHLIISQSNIFLEWLLSLAHVNFMASINGISATDKFKVMFNIVIHVITSAIVQIEVGQ
mmetsp:Transcript_20940/g.34138  ORF Transcript_20940/g.34138 Transcript_20940/m.34138 type:complete len:88 (+) Transcript_20940:96-359(+)